MAALLVTLRGIRHRSGRSALVFLLAALATAAAVLGPAYARAAEQSALADQMRAVPPQSLGLTISGATVSGVPLSVLASRAPAAVHRHPEIGAVTTAPYRGSQAVVTISSLTSSPGVRLVYRAALCDHLRIVSGHCPTPGDGAVLVDADNARRYDLSVGDTITVKAPAGAPRPAFGYRHRVAGLYRVRDAGERYWWGGGNFGSGGQDGGDRLQPVFSTDPGAAGWPGTRAARAELDYPVDADRIDMDAVPALSRAVGALDAEMSARNAHLGTALPGAFDKAAADQRSIGDAVPVVALPLVLLSWFVLYQTVAALVEERGPEVALAKLRGFRMPAAVRFGLGEAFLLIVAAAPVGLALGLGLVQAVASTVLAAGTGVELRGPVWLVTLAALAGAVVAAVLAARRTVTRPVLALLRRVPKRGRWQATVVEGGLVALAAAAVYQLVSDPTSALGLLAALVMIPPLTPARRSGATGWPKIHPRNLPAAAPAGSPRK
ncbi:MAG: FtsX-like permease family protein [Actinocatenispora sp.]